MNVAGAQPDDGARPIGELLKRLMRRKKFYQKGKHTALASAWRELVGEAVAERTRIRSFKDGTLTVEVDSSVLLHELNGFMKHQILAGLQDRDEGADVADLRFRLGRGGQEDN